MKITESKFKGLLTDSRPVNFSQELDELGDFFIHNNGKILFRGKKYWAEGILMILDILSDLIDFDPELAKIIPVDNIRYKKIEALTNGDDIGLYYDIEVENGKIVNLSKLLVLLSSSTGINITSLDFTIDSFKVIDDVLQDNVNLDKYFLLTVFIGYVAKVVMRNHDNVYLSIEDDGGNFYINAGKGSCSNIGAHVSDWILEADYCPNITMVYRSVLEDINRKV
jgi:hypothetical protein